MQTHMFSGNKNEQKNIILIHVSLNSCNGIHVVSAESQWGDNNNFLIKDIHYFILNLYNLACEQNFLMHGVCLFFFSNMSLLSNGNHCGQNNYNKLLLYLHHYNII